MRVTRAKRTMQAQNQSTYFSWCVRCMGHGHFVIPPDGAQNEVFSRNAAYYQLRSLALAGRISMNTLAVLTSQVVNSGLPETCPPDVKEAIQLFFETEAWAGRFSESEGNKSRHIYINTKDLAMVVHEHYLTSLPQLRSQ